MRARTTSLATCASGLGLDVSTRRVNFAQVDELKRVGTAGEARHHEVVVVGRESDPPTRAAGASHLIFMLGHDVTVTEGRDDSAIRCPAGGSLALA